MNEYYLNYYKELCPHQENWIYEQLAEEREKLERELADQAVRLRDEIARRQEVVRANRKLDLEERDQLRDQLAAARQRETVAIASWDEERGRALREGARVVEWITRADRAQESRTQGGQMSDNDHNITNDINITLESIKRRNAAIDYLIKDSPPNCTRIILEITTEGHNLSFYSPSIDNLKRYSYTNLNGEWIK